jgi:hypothetical protein
MAKYGRVLGLEEPEPRRRRGRLVLALALAVAASPLLYEGAGVVVARWQTMLGTYQQVQTPLFDRIAETWREARGDLQRRAPALLHTGRWSPSMAVPAVIGIALFGMLFLRRGN